jgi:hypothetical protein
MPTDLLETLPALAIRRLATLFPSRYSHLLKAPAPKSAPVTSGRCSQRACCFPAWRDGLCRQHVADASMQFSVMRSTIGVALENTTSRISVSA